MISEGHSQPRKSNIQKAIILVINVPKHLCLVYKCLIETLLHQRCKSGTSICAIFYGLVLIFELSQHAPAHHCYQHQITSAIYLCMMLIGETKMAFSCYILTGSSWFYWKFMQFCRKLDYGVIHV